MSSFIYFLFNVHRCFAYIYICGCATYVQHLQGLEEASDPLGQELQTVVNCYVGAHFGIHSINSSPMLFQKYYPRMGYKLQHTE